MNWLVQWLRSSNDDATWENSDEIISRYPDFKYNEEKPIQEQEAGGLGSFLSRVDLLRT